jgi:DNA-directed RNA polymerase specialized sigma24 family protein
VAESRCELERLFRHLDARLPPKGRVIMRLLYEDELSVHEAAQKLGIQPQVVYNWQFRIRAEARDFASP